LPFFTPGKWLLDRILVETLRPINDHHVTLAQLVSHQ
jgi:hypothetical protein